MDKKTFIEKLAKNPRPVVVDLWAPWCGPCRMIKPTLEKLAREYSGKVDLWQVNADENKELLSELGVYGIPTLIVFQNGQELFRQVGAKSPDDLKKLFDTLAAGGVPAPAGLGFGSRLIRVGLGIALAALAWTSGGSWLIFAFAGVVIFSAVYDRCPIWQALTRQIKKLAGGA